MDKWEVIFQAELLEKLKNPILEKRADAARSLNRYDDARTIFALAEALNDDQSEVRVWVNFSLWRSLERNLINCHTADQIERFEGISDSVFVFIRKQWSDKDFFNKWKFCLAELKRRAAKKKNELAQDKGVLLTDIPKPPKKGLMYQSIRMGRIRNG